MIVQSYVADFWQHAVYVGSANPRVIRSRIGEFSIEIFVHDIREALGFGDVNEDPISVSSVTICGVFDRMGYTGNAGDSQLEKKHLYGQWR